MSNLNKIAILLKFHPYLRLIRAYNSENFRQNGGWRCSWPSAYCALLASVMIGSMSIGMALIAWNLLKNGDDVKVLVVNTDDIELISYGPIIRGLGMEE